MTKSEHDSASKNETESQLIQRAQQSISQCHWVVGECATLWTQRFARGRTDADFGNLIGLSGDQVYQRRRVWESFADVADQFPNLKWSHFYTALNWDDAMECLQWSEETEGTIAEMKAWRRSHRGEDLQAEEESALEDLNSPLYLQTALVQDPAAGGARNGRRGEAPPFDVGPEYDAEGNPVVHMAGVARDFDQGNNYAPFRQDAMKPPRETKERSTTATPLTTEQLAKRLCNTLERCTKAISSDFLEEFSTLPPALQQRVRDAFQELSDKLSDV